MPSAAAVRLNLLGRFELVVNGSRVDLVDSAQRLLVFLALHDRPQRRLVVAGNLWPEKSDGRATANLRSALWRARTPEGRTLVVARGQHVALADDVVLDMREMEDRGWALVEGRIPSPLSRATRDHFLHELLPGWYDEWVILERERLGQLRLHFLEAFIDALVGERRYAEALDTAFRLVAADPIRERSYDALVRVYVAEGSLNRARTYRDSSMEAAARHG
jgi:DNA-binding SARP family transcriptional activator